MRENTVKSLLGVGRVVIDVSSLHLSQAAFVIVFPAVLAAAGGWPSARLVLFDTAPSAARRFVRETCELWQLPPTVREVAELVATELVTNAVEHAHSSNRLTLTFTRSAFGVAVRDYCSSAIPRPRPIDVNALRDRGLHLAQAWGGNQRPDGKTIWASLPLDSPE